MVSKSVSTNDQLFATSWWLFQFIPYERHIHQCEMRGGKHFPVAISNKAVNIVECQNKEYELDLSCRRFLMQKKICLVAELLMLLFLTLVYCLQCGKHNFFTGSHPDFWPNFFLDCPSVAAVNLD